MLIHLPTSLYEGFPFLLKKLRFLHDFHLLKFIMESTSFYTYNKGKKQKQIRNRKTRWWWWRSERESERKEKEEVEVWEHLSSTLGLFIWGAGLGCQMWHHTQTNTLDRRVRKVSDKSRDCFSLSIKKVSDRWHRSLFVIVCVCATCIAVTADSPLKTQQQELTEMTALILPCCTKWQQINMIQSDLNRKKHSAWHSWLRQPLPLLQCKRKKTQDIRSKLWHGSWYLIQVCEPVQWNREQGKGLSPFAHWHI